MPGFDGTGPRGTGPMTGGGRGFCSPLGRRASWRSYGAIRGVPYAFPRYGAYGFRSFTPRVAPEQELEFLKGQAEALKDELKELENEIGKLSARE